MKLASIEQVATVQPHPNADRLDIAKVLGWQTVTKRGAFSAGDRGVFVVIDTILPRQHWSEFLVDAKTPEKPIRLRTAKLRGEFSQGLLLPLEILPENVRGWQIGADVGGELGIRKYEKEIPLALSGIAKGGFPTHLVACTDEDNGLSYPDVVQMVLSAGIVFVTQKLDGSSGTVIVRDGKAEHVCSRRLSLLDSPGNAFWHAVRRLDLTRLPDCVIQGELMGPGIQGNQLELKEPTLFVFNIFRDFIPLDFDGMREMAMSIGANMVPLAGWGLYGDHQPARLDIISQCQSLADSQMLPSGKPAEGIVVRMHPTQRFGNGRVAGFKVINRNYTDTD